MTHSYDTLATVKDCAEHKHLEAINHFQNKLSHEAFAKTDKEKQALKQAKAEFKKSVKTSV